MRRIGRGLLVGAWLVALLASPAHGAERPLLRELPETRPGGVEDAAELGDDEGDGSTETRHVVRFESEPSGAVVLVDGEVVCQSTPCSRELEPGRHEVSVRKERYLDVDREIGVRGDREVSVELQPDFATIDVHSEPDGLPVTVGGEQVGETPLDDHRIPAGERVRIEADDRCHRTTSKSVELARWASERVTLSPEPVPARVDVSAEDGEGNALVADVLVGGGKVGETPGAFEVPACADELTVRHEELGQTSRELSLSPRETTRVALELRRGGRTKEGRGGVTWVRIPGGTFMMGSNSSNHPPTAPGVEVNPSTPTAGEPLVCEVAEPSTDADGDEVSYAYAWYEGEEGADGEPDHEGETLPAGTTEGGEVWTCEVVPSDGEANGPAGSDSVGVHATPPCEDPIADGERVWPQEAPVESCTAAGGQNYPATGEGAANWFEYGGCGGWKEYPATPGHPVTIHAKTDDCLSCVLWHIGFHLREDTGNGWETMETHDPPDVKGSELKISYTPQTEAFRIDALDGFYVTVHTCPP